MSNSDPIAKIYQDKLEELRQLARDLEAYRDVASVMPPHIKNLQHLVGAVASVKDAISSLTRIQ